MKKSTPFLIALLLLLLQFSLSAQVQWFQNQDGNNPYPNGTVATAVQGLTANSFVASYLWHVDNDQFTWKISKTRLDGVEQKSFFITGSTTQVEARVGKRNSIYILQKDFPAGVDPQYTLLKLDSNLVVKSQQAITFPGGFSVFNMNAFRLDENDNIYVAGDGQYPDGPGFLPASFLLKKDKHLNTHWIKMDSVQTAYTDVQVDGSGNVWLIEDYYGTFPDIRITKRNTNGQVKWRKTITTESGRFGLAAAITEDDHLVLYGGKTINDNAQGIYLWKVSRTNGNVVYRKTHFAANGVSMTDLKQDRMGNVFMLVSQFFNPDRMVSKVGRVNSWTGNLHWSRSFNYAQDSCNLMKIVMNNNDRFFVVGEKKKNNILSRGFSLRIKKNGQVETDFVSPDSVSQMRSHWLIDGIIDRNNQLISVGLTQDLDTVTYQSTYLRSFAIRFGDRRRNNNSWDCFDQHNQVDVTTAGIAIDGDENAKTFTKPVVFPNPAQKDLMVTNLAEDKYDRLTVFNLQGAQVLQQSVNGNMTRLDVSALPGGVYVLQLQSTTLNKQKTLRFIVQK